MPPFRAPVFAPDAVLADSAHRWTADLVEQEAARLGLDEETDRKARRRKKKEILTTVRRAINHRVYCPACGDPILRQNETDIEWNRSRRCPACLDADKSFGDRKFCRHCGQQMLRAEYAATCARFVSAVSLAKKWATLAHCGRCAQSIKEVKAAAQRLLLE